MTKFKRFHLKNEMLFANILANLIAVSFFQVLMFRADAQFFQSDRSFSELN